MQENVLCIEIGGSHILSAVAVVGGDEIVFKGICERKINSAAAKETILTEWGICIDQTLDEAAGVSLDRIHVGMPGPFDYVNGISLIRNMNKYDALYGFDVRKFLSEAYQIPTSHILFENDALCFLRGQIERNPVLKTRKVLGLTLGTGLGASLYENGSVFDLDLGKEPFLHGITEDYISIRALMLDYSSNGGQEFRSVKEIINAVSHNNLSKNVVDRFSTHLALFVKSCSERYGMHDVVLGGGISNGASAFLPLTVELLNEEGIDIDFLVADLSDEAILTGVAVAS